MSLFTRLEIAGAVLLGIIWMVATTYNRLVKLLNQVRTDFSDIDIQLKRRSSLIQNLVDTVKDYSKHEHNTFTRVAEARSAVDRSHTVSEAARADSLLSETLRGVYMVVEKYPELKANENYKQLQHDLVSTENMIAEHREEYNRSVQKYNNAVLTFPSLLIAGLFRFREEQYFTVS